MSIFQPLPDKEGCSYLRLLRLQPGDYDDPIECTLDIVTHVESRDQYEAISYCWGDAKDTVPVICNSLKVPITRTLKSALRRFRNPSGSTTRALWADALCINQKDDKEKGKQVGRMGEVFANASRVLVWLGGDVDHDMASRTFMILSEIDQCLEEMSPTQEPFPIRVEVYKYTGLDVLLKSPWFFRVWTLQVN
jgi:hypothetical protein